MVVVRAQQNVKHGHTQHWAWPWQRLINDASLDASGFITTTLSAFPFTFDKMPIVISLGFILPYQNLIVLFFFPYLAKKKKKRWCKHMHSNENGMEIHGLHFFLNLWNIKLQRSRSIGTKGLIEATEHLWHTHKVNLETQVKQLFLAWILCIWCWYNITHQYPCRAWLSWSTS